MRIILYKCCLSTSHEFLNISYLLQKPSNTNNLVQNGVAGHLNTMGGVTMYIITSRTGNIMDILVL